MTYLEAELDMFARYPGREDPAALFILAAPRTGSTILYQAMAQALALPVITNYANASTPVQPVVGILESHAVRTCASFEASFSSQFGKTEGPHGVSEGSAIFAFWCGGGHPSEIRSPGVLPERAEHMRKTFAGVEAATGAPLLTKNAWNCFRLRDLARRFPNAAFIWLRRDALKAAESDLAARRVVQGDTTVWNSATPRNVEALGMLAPWQQVLENQFEFSRAIREAAQGLPPARFCEVWYEDFLQDPNGVIGALSAGLVAIGERETGVLPAFAPTKPADVAGNDRDAMRDFVNAERTRWAPLLRSSPQ